MFCSRRYVCRLRAFSIYKKNPENFHWEFPFGKSAFHLSHVPFVHRPLSVASPNDQMPLVNCSAIVSNTSFFVPFKRRLTSVSFHLPRCSGIETLPVNEELPKNFQSCSCNILDGKCAPEKTASNEQEFLPTTLIYGTFVLQ